MERGCDKSKAGALRVECPLRHSIDIVGVGGGGRWKGRVGVMPRKEGSSEEEHIG